MTIAAISWHHWDVRIEQIAAEQLGLFTRAQAAACGVCPTTLSRRVAAGSLDRVHDGVFRYAASAVHPHSTILAAVLRAGDGAFAAASSGLFVHGLRRTSPHPVELVSPRQTSFPGARIVRSVLPYAEQRTVGPVPVVCAERAIIQAAAYFGEDALHQLVADAVRTGVTKVERIARLLDATPPRRAAGAATLRRLLAGGLSYSHPERRLVQLLRDAGIRDVQPNLPFVGPSGRLWKIDAAIAHVLVAVEVDSFAHHVGPAQQQADIDKYADLQEAGWELVRCTAKDVHERPQLVVRRVKAAIARARERSIS